MKKFGILLPGLLAAALIAGPTPAHASCAVQLPLVESLAASSVAFTGTVLSVDGGDRIAQVLVDEVWKGGPLPMQVEVRGGPGDPQSITSVDRSFARGDKYLFVPINDESPFQDNACTATREYSPDLEDSRPLDASMPNGGAPLPAEPSVAPDGGGLPVASPAEPSGNEGPSQAMKGLLYILALAVAAGIGYLMKRGSRKVG